MSLSDAQRKKWCKKYQYLVYLILVVIGFTLALLSKFLPIFPALTLKALADANITELLTGTIFVTLIIERSLEVFISVWREPEKIKMQKRIKKLHSSNLKEESADASLESSVSEEAPAIIEYKGNTKIFALCVGFFLGIVSALVGVRILEPLVDITRITDPNQLRAFRSLDILLTGLAISGGSQVFHELISVFTDFLAVTRNRVDASE